MFVKGLRFALLLIAFDTAFIWSASADELPPPPVISNDGPTVKSDGPAISNDGIKELESRIVSLRAAGKNQEADELLLQSGKAVEQLMGGKPMALPEIQLPWPSHDTLPSHQRPAVRQVASPSNISKEQRVRNLMAAAASLKAAGMEADAARYAQMAAQLAQEGSSAEVTALRMEVERLHWEVQCLRQELQRLETTISQHQAGPSRPITTYSPEHEVPPSTTPVPSLPESPKTP